MYQRDKGQAFTAQEAVVAKLATALFTSVDKACPSLCTEGVQAWALPRNELI